MPNPYDANVQNFNFRVGIFPTAGSELDIPIISNARTKLVALTTTLQTDANVANRIVTLTVDNNVEEMPIAVLHTVLPASQSVKLMFGVGLTEYTQTSGSWLVVPIVPDMWVLSGGYWHIRIENIQAGDQIGNWTLMEHFSPFYKG